MLGRSGTGKSVLLKLIIGLEQPDSGSICIHGQEIVGLPIGRLNEIRKTVGFLFQYSALYDSLTVEQNVKFPLKRQTTMSARERSERAREMLAKVGLEEHREKMPAEITGGMQKRVGLARALALEPSILLFDEPTSGLDPITSREIEDLIVQLQREHNIASIVVTQDIHGAQSISDRLALMREGNILIDGTFEDRENSRDEFVRQFLRDGGYSRSRGPAERQSTESSEQSRHDQVKQSHG